jgi:hypothetical protein
MSQPNPPDLDQTMADAAKWRKLTDLLRAKAYKTMTPEEISGQFPDLRQLYREINHWSNGYSRGASQ